MNNYRIIIVVTNPNYDEVYFIKENNSYLCNELNNLKKGNIDFIQVTRITGETVFLNPKNFASFEIRVRGEVNE